MAWMIVWWAGVLVLYARYKHQEADEAVKALNDLPGETRVVNAEGAE